MCIILINAIETDTRWHIRTHLLQVTSFFFCFPNHLESLDKRLNTFLYYVFGARGMYFPMKSPLYLLIVYLGPKYTRNRPLYSLKGVLLVYNFSVSMLSLYMLVEVSYRLQCQGLHEAGEADVRVKVEYFCKQQGQSDRYMKGKFIQCWPYDFLHVYHHASMFNIWWSVLNWIPCGQSFFGPTLNSFIHKHYLTQAQLVQLLLSIIHTLGAVIVPCGFPIRRLLIQVSYMATLVILFVNVYIQTYRKRRPSEDDKLTFEQSHIKSSHPNGHSASTNGTSLKKRQ
uniref:Elongation of very long chain fatty acids protein n=1 Tax=Oncorhynchus mykiss TaxID=8022 RepID=A0A8C7UT73_ONCMY